MRRGCGLPTMLMFGWMGRLFASGTPPAQRASQLGEAANAGSAESLPDDHLSKGRTTLAKGRSTRNREAKKPKADKKPTQAGSTFLRPQPTGKPLAAKETTKPS